MMKWSKLVEHTSHALTMTDNDFASVFINDSRNKWLLTHFLVHLEKKSRLFIHNSCIIVIKNDIGSTTNRFMCKGRNIQFTGLLFIVTILL